MKKFISFYLQKNNDLPVPGLELVLLRSGSGRIQIQKFLNFNTQFVVEIKCVYWKKTISQSFLQKYLKDTINHQIQ